MFLSRRRAIAALVVITAALAIAYGVAFVLKPPRFPYPTYRFTSLSEEGCDDGLKSSSANGDRITIPNLVHYVWILRDSSEFRLGFKFFVSAYSAHFYWHPDRIYIHTDAAPEVIERAKNSGTPWTQRVLALPGLTINRVETPQTTRRGVRIEALEHKSDFVRLEALKQFGGVYLDADAMPLRDIADLRNSGFRNVIGQQMGLAMWLTGYLNNGVMMSVPRSNMISVFYHAAQEFFDGQWDTASIKLLTDLGNRLAGIPSEVLILQPQAFSPTSWEYSDQKRIFLETLDAATAPGPEEQRKERLLMDEVANSGTCKDVLAWLKHGERSGKVSDPWELDFSSTYVLHAVDNHASSIIGGGRDVDVDYILAQKSSYARALFPAVWNAVQEGIIPKP